MKRKSLHNDRVIKEVTMAHVLRETRYVERGQDQDAGLITAARVVYFINTVVSGLLAIRFLLVLLGANTLNAFAAFIYDVTRPLVAPFFGLFNYQAAYGRARFEYETLVAIAVYSLIAWAIVRLLAIGSHDDRIETE
jgi:hypothetical protein